MKTKEEDIQIIDMPMNIAYDDFTKFKEWCKTEDVYYYAKPKEDFSKREALELAKKNGNKYLVLDDIS
jgi:hypothetical protein